jgi:hypothetical protein
LSIDNLSEIMPRFRTCKFAAGDENHSDWNNRYTGASHHMIERHRIETIVRGRCASVGKSPEVIYRGPFREVLDDDNHQMERGKRYAVCDKTYNLYKKAPYREFFEFVESIIDVPLAEAKPFDCSRSSLRHPKETKGQHLLRWR